MTEQPSPHNAPAVWRPGRKVGRTLYIHRNNEEAGQLIGMVDTHQLAIAICDAMNSRPQGSPTGPRPQDVPDDLLDMYGRNYIGVTPKAAHRYAMAAVVPEIERRALRNAAEALLARGFHGDRCSYGPPGTCDCTLGEHYRWLINRSGGTSDDQEHGGTT